MKDWNVDEFKRDVLEEAERVSDTPRAAHEKSDEGTKANQELPTIDVTAWEGQDVPPRDWIVRDRVIRRNVALLSGEGGVGKSVLLMQLGVACGLARDWVGRMPESGPVIYLNAEDDAREIHYRLAAIADHYGATFAELKDFHPITLAGEDAVLGVPDRSGIIRPTIVFDRLRATAKRIRPVLIALDTAADLYGANENDRANVRQFIGMLRGLAIAVNCGVILASHPSVGGIATDSGLSGSTGWHNGPRTRLYFKSVANADGEENSDLRDLICKKSNYGPSGEQIRLRWQNGVFVPLGSPSSLERAAADQKADEIFLELLDRFRAQGRNVGDKHGTAYAPALFAQEPEAKTAKLGKEALAAAMRRLFTANRIHVETYGRPSRQSSRLALGPKP